MFFFEDSTINEISQKFEFDETRHRQIFDAIDHDNDGYISKKEWMKATALSLEQCVIPMDKIHKIFEEMNDGKKVSFDLWMKCVSAVRSEEKEKEKKNNSVHIMTVMKCVENVWKSLGSAHREGAYQKALLFDLREHGYSVQMERRVPVYHFTKYRKKLHLVSIERIDLFIEAPATVIETKAVSAKLSVKDEYQTKKYSKNKKCLSFLVNFPNNRDELEMKCWTIDENNDFTPHNLEQYQGISCQKL